MVKCSKVLQCSVGTSNKVSNIIKRHIDNKKLLLICILLLSHSLIFFRFIFINIWLYSCLILDLCIFIVRVYIFPLFSMYSYCSSMYSYCCLCILIVVYVFLDTATLTEVFPCFFLSCKANARV